MPYLGNSHIAGDQINNFKVLDDISSHTSTFDGSASGVVSTSDNTIRIAEHRFVQGQRVTYNNGGGGNIGNLSSGTAYYVIKDTNNTIKLATSLSDANNSTAINLSVLGSGSSHTLNVAFDGVNTKFKVTHNGGTPGRINNATQLSLAINNVIQRPNQNVATFTEGFAIEDQHKIIFKVAPVSSDIFWGSILANTLPTFDITDNKIDNFTGDGSTTEFNLSNIPASNKSIMVTINGVLQHPSDGSTSRSYTLLSNILQFTAAPGNGDEIQVRHIGFAGASTSDVTGFYGRTGNVVLTSNDHITTGNINAGIVTATNFVGNLTGNVSGNLTVGGVLTYEDVTNVDSIGIITARSGFKVLAGGANVVGVITARTNIHLEDYIHHLGDLTTKIGFPAAGTITVDTAGDERLRITSDGKVGINTASPQTILHIRQAADGNTDGFRISRPNGNATYSQFIDSGSRFNIGYSNPNTADPDPQISLDQNGRVGINSTVPTAKLEVYAQGNSEKGIRLLDSNASQSAPYIEVIGKRSDGNSSQGFGGKIHLAKNYTNDKINSGNILGAVAFGGNHTDGTEANILYTASISAVASDSFDSATDMPTDLIFLTGITGKTPTAVNTTTGNERLRIDSDGDIIHTSVDKTLSLVTTRNVINAGTKIAFFGANRYTTDEEFASIKGGLTTNSGGSGKQGGYLEFTVGTASHKVRINGDGKVGIGTDDPKTKLNVYTFPHSDTGGILVQNANYSANLDKPYLIAGTQTWTGAATDWSTYGFQHKLKSNSSGQPRLTIDGAPGGSSLVEIITFLHNGSVGINTDQIYDSTTKLEVRGRINTVGSASTGSLNYGNGTVVNVGSLSPHNLQLMTGNSTRMLFENGTGTAVTLKSSGEMGVNTNAPVEKLGISGNMRFVNPNGTTSRITALPSGSYSTGTSGGSAICFQRIADGGGGSDEIFFETHWQGNRHGESCRINKYGNLAFPSGQGIDFSATGDASSMDSELLDDYEEGSWTPSYSNGSGSITVNGSYSIQYGKYIKIGKMVYVEGGLRANVTNNSNGTYDIAGLPFTIANDVSSSGILMCKEQSSWTVAPDHFSTMNNTNHARARAGLNDGASAYTNGNTSHFNSGSTNNNRIYFSGSYRAA